jgi:hypothetical protein
MMTDTKFKDGDIFKWRWKDDDRHMDCGPYRSYHCKSQIAVAKDGQLFDTFWGDWSSDRVINLDKVIITFLGNENEMEKINECDAQFYKGEDIVDMNHSNNTRAPVYLKPGAKRDAETMRAVIEHELSDQECTIRSATNKAERLRAALTVIEDGRLDEVGYI